MDDEKLIDDKILVEQRIITPAFLERDVIIDAYLPTNIVYPEKMSLLLINDGQDLPKMPFDEILEGLIAALVPAQEHSVIVVGGGIVGIDLERPFERLLGQAVVAEGHIRQT